MLKHQKMFITDFFRPLNETTKPRANWPTPTSSPIRTEPSSSYSSAQSQRTSSPVTAISNPPFPSQSSYKIDPQVKAASERYDMAASRGYIPPRESSCDALIFEKYSSCGY